METTIERDLTNRDVDERYRALTAELVRDLDEAVGAIVRAVQNGGAGKASITVKYTAALDEDGQCIVDYQHTHSSVHKGKYQPGGRGQLRLIEP